MATISDIAKECGLSSATVSYVLSGKAEERRIPKDTQTLVINTANTLGYKKSIPSTQRRKNIQIAFYWQKTGFEMVIPAIFEKINSVVSSSNIGVDVIFRPYDVGHLGKDEYLFSSSYYDGAVLTGPITEDLQFLQTHKPTIPLVIINRQVEGYSWVSMDDVETGRMAALHAIKNGEGSIATILSPASYVCMSIRGKEFIGTCKEKGFDLSESVYFCDNHIDSGHTLGMRLVAAGKLKKIYFCNNDMAALGLMSAFNEMGVKVGQDVEVFSASNGPAELMARSTPPLTVIDLKMGEIAERSLRMIIDIITKRVSGVQQQMVYPSIIYRQSSPAPKLI